MRHKKYYFKNGNNQYIYWACLIFILIYGNIGNIILSSWYIYENDGFTK